MDESHKERAAADQAPGWRARIGVIIPTVNTVTEPELNAVKPDGVTVHFTRMPIHRNPAEDGFKALMTDLDIRLDEFRTCGVDIVAYNCTVGSMGLPAETLIDKLKEGTLEPGGPAVATFSSVIAAFEALGVKRVALASPYTDETNQHEADILAANGIEVVRAAGMNFGHGEAAGRMYARVTPEQIKAHARSVDCPEAEAIFLSCANFPSASVVEELETELGKPVVTSNLATFWASLRAGGITEPIHGYGRLLAEH